MRESQSGCPSLADVHLCSFLGAQIGNSCSAQKERAKTNQTNAIHKALQEINASNASGKNNRNAADFGDYPNPMRSPYKGSSRTAGKENGGFGTDGMDVDGKRRLRRFIKHSRIYVYS